MGVAVLALELLYAAEEATLVAVLAGAALVARVLTRLELNRRVADTVLAAGLQPLRGSFGRALQSRLAAHDQMTTAER